jgi:hypothetical protein
MHFGKPYVIVTGLDQAKFKTTTMVLGLADVDEEDDGCYEIKGYEPIWVDDFYVARDLVEKCLQAEEE